MYRSHRLRVLATVLLTAAVAASAGTVTSATPAAAGTVAQPAIVSAVPSLSTPEVKDGRVQALAQVGEAIVFAGTFTQVSDRGGTIGPQRYLAAYDRRTGALLPGFAPVLDGEVKALLPGPTAGSVYVGGSFRTVNGRPALRLALLSVASGTAVPGFRPAPVDRPVTSLARSGGRLYVGGVFTRVGGVAHGGLASLDAGTGALDPFVGLQVAGHHNYGRYGGVPKGSVGVLDLAVAPDGRQLTAIGNFRTVDGLARDQVAVVDLTGSSARVRTDWATSLFTAPCNSWAFDSWVRDVDYSPDGSYFVIGSTGGGIKDLCDTVVRFGAADRGSDVRPTWVASAGGDSIYSVAATGSAIYAGGHFRWFNDPLANNVAGPGAVARPGIVALDPVNGLPLSWNPGRHPRDKGAFALLATDRELVVGTDTDWTGYEKYYTPRLTSFPTKGGRAVEDRSTPQLPGTLNRIGQDGAGRAVLLTSPATSTSVAPPRAPQRSYQLGLVRGAMVVGDWAYLAGSDGVLRRRAYSAAGLGDGGPLDPYNDPDWDTLPTGVKGTTYRGLNSGFDQDMPHLTSMFYLGSRVYYTVQGSSALRYRDFETATGITSPVVATVPGVSLPPLAGGTYANGALYYARASDGVLVRQPFDGRSLQGGPSALSGPGLDGQDWRTAALFAGLPVR